MRTQLSIQACQVITEKYDENGRLVLPKEGEEALARGEPLNASMVQMSYAMPHGRMLDSRRVVGLSSRGWQEAVRGVCKRY